jgi:hypothetical protein
VIESVINPAIKMTTNTIGPNVKKLLVMRMSQIAIPTGSGSESFALGLEALTTPGRMSDIAKQASDWLQEQFAQIRSTVLEGTFASDEDIAGEVLRQLTGKK